MLPLPVRFLLMVMPLLGACTKPWSSSYEYTCPDGYEFTIAFSDTDNPGDIAVFEDADGTVKLPRAPSASGMRYSNEAIEFFGQGNEAMIRRGGTIAHRACTTE